MVEINCTFLIYSKAIEFDLRVGIADTSMILKMRLLAITRLSSITLSIKSGSGVLFGHRLACFSLLPF